MKKQHGHQPNSHEHSHPSTIQPHTHTTVVVTAPLLGAHPNSFYYHSHQQPYYIPQQHRSHQPYTHQQPRTHEHHHDEHSHSHTP